MCSECGCEYTAYGTVYTQPELICPACGCTEGIPILPFDEERDELTSWELENDYQE
jgi:hypothetical protein